MGAEELERRWRKAEEIATLEAALVAQPMTPTALRAIADFLDLADQAFALLARAQTVEHLVPQGGVQADLRRWANELEA